MKTTAPLRAFPFLPLLSLRFVSMWRRNFLVWKKLAPTRLLGNLADPMLYMLGLGYGLGSLLPQVGGVPYITFLAAGTVCFSTMNSATFEALYGAFSRLQQQRTWDAILNTPMNLDDIMLAEAIWAASLSFVSGMAILVVAWLLGLVASPLALWVIPLIFLTGLCFACMGMVMTVLAPGYDFFMYYFTLVVTPMTLLCGVFFPVSQLPDFLQFISGLLPLTHAIAIARPLFIGQVPDAILIHLLVLVGYGVTGFCVAVVLGRRRLLK